MKKQKHIGTEPQQQGTSISAGDATPGERTRMIAVAAFYLAEMRGFSPGREMEDWLRAEQKIDSVEADTAVES